LKAKFRDRQTTNKLLPDLLPLFFRNGWFSQLPVFVANQVVVNGPVGLQGKKSCTYESQTCLHEDQISFLCTCQPKGRTKINSMKQVAWITGASSGIGEELSKQLADKGLKLILSARNTAKLNELKSILPNSEEHLVVPLDLEHSEGFIALAKDVLSKTGRIDFLYNIGGLSQRAQASETPIELDRRIMEINYFGTVALTKAVLPFMQQQKAGHIVVISSIAGKFGFYLRSAYSASKHALHGFFESLLLEEAHNNIHVTIACPGKINTPISMSALNKEGKAHGEMDHNQETGMPVAECVNILLNAVDQRKKEVLIGNKEIKAVTLKRFFPKLFWKIIAKQSAT
jgi:dehydrogenase/reductase SDR family protein 7B